MWTDKRLLEELTEGGAIDIDSYFLSSIEGVENASVIGHWQVRDSELVSMAMMIDDEEFAEAAAKFLIRLGKPHFKSVEEEEAARLKLQREMFPSRP